MIRVVVAGPLASKPYNGGGAWSRLSWVLGLRRLGCDAWFLEQLDSCSDEALASFDTAVAQLGVGDRALLLDGSGRALRGEVDVDQLCGSAELLVNHSGHLADERLKRLFRRRLYVDGDPGFTQIWHAAGHRGARLEGHDLYSNVGENVGRPGCPIPTDGIAWRAIRQPVPLDWWPPATNGAADRFTTIGSWRGPYGPVIHAGRTYGLKVHEFRRFVELPQRAPQRFELALDIHPAEESDRRLLREHGWRLVDPRALAGDPLSYRAYVQGSGAEFSVAQGVYVETGSGWFSDRTARYLAAGKPALVQESGFSRNLPVGEGLVPFATLDEAVAGATRIAGDYERHARAARRLAEEYFDAEKVLGRVLEEAA